MPAIDPRFLAESGREVFIGNELLVKGALETEGGVGLMTGYPGSPVAGCFDVMGEISDLLKSKGALNYQNAFVQADFIGSGPHVKEGSPAENANSFLAPVLMFQGDIDLNVDISQSRVMDRQLRSAGKSGELIVYKDLDHGLLDSTVRAEVLRKSDAFLRKYLKL